MSINPLIRNIAPLNPAGETFSPYPLYAQSGDELADVIREVASILHPELFRRERIKYFRRLPQEDPMDRTARR